jgi:hypothetical protein
MRRRFCALIVVCAVVCSLTAAPAAQAFLPSDLPTDGVTPPDGGTPDTIGNSGSPPPVDAPEPATLVLGLVGTGVLGLCLRRRRNSEAAGTAITNEERWA